MCGLAIRSRLLLLLLLLVLGLGGAPASCGDERRTSGWDNGGEGEGEGEAAPDGGAGAGGADIGRGEALPDTGTGAGDGGGVPGEAPCSPRWVRVVFAVQLAEGMLDGACRLIDPYRWAQDQPGSSMFVTGAVHQDYAGLTEEQRNEISALLGRWVPNSVAMYDDGSHGDGAAGDGIWSRSFDLSQGEPPVQLAYKYTWGRPGNGWTNTEEWPGNSRLLELVDVNGDGLVVRYDRFGDEASNKDRASSGCRGRIDWTTDCNGDGCADARECAMDLDGDCLPDGYPPFSASPLPPCTD